MATVEETKPSNFFNRSRQQQLDARLSRQERRRFHEGIRRIPRWSMQIASDERNVQREAWLSTTTKMTTVDGRRRCAAVTLQACFPSVFFFFSSFLLLFFFFFLSSCVVVDEWIFRLICAPYIYSERVTWSRGPAWRVTLTYLMNITWPSYSSHLVYKRANSRRRFWLNKLIADWSESRVVIG